MRFPFEVKTDAKFDAVGFGTNAVDYLIQVPEYPAFDSKMELTEYVKAAGGEVATTLVGLQRLGFRTAYIGRFGKDSEGDFGLENLRDEGVDISRTEQVEGARTQIAFIIIDERNGERTVIWKRDQKLGYSGTEVDESSVDDTRILHFTPHDTEACIKLATAAKKSGAVISIDIDRVFDGIEILLPIVDILICSSEFPKRLFGIDDISRSLEKLQASFGCPITGMTLGDAGSIIYSVGSFIRTPGMAVPGGCNDTTGAGDSFRAGFLYGLLCGETIEDSARMANAVAALKCREVGARTSLPNQEELSHLLKC